MIVRPSSEIDFGNSGPPVFAGVELKLPENLTIFGADVPEFSEWANSRGAKKICRVEDQIEFSGNAHAFVIHEFATEISLEDFGEFGDCIERLMANAQELIVFLSVKEKCTPESLRNSLAKNLPNYTFRVIYPRGTFSRTTGAKCILIRRKRPRAFLFISGAAMVGKTETALSLCKGDAPIIVHGDEYLHGVKSGEIEAGTELREYVERWHSAPFDQSMFKKLLALIPAVGQGKDIILDLFIPYGNHAQALDCFYDLGYFPIFCQLPSDQKHSDSERERLQRSCESYRIAHENSLRELEDCRSALRATLDSTSWRLTGWIRSIGPCLPVAAKIGRRLVGT